MTLLQLVVYFFSWFYRVLFLFVVVDHVFDWIYASVIFGCGFHLVRIWFKPELRSFPSFGLVQDTGDILCMPV